MTDGKPERTARRRVLKGAGTVAASGLVGLAGCGGDPANGDDGEATLPTEPDYKGWFNNVGNYKRTKDRRGHSSITVEVGVQANNGFLGFGPPAVAISPGAEVVWDWTGKGGAHNVVSEAGLFHSGDPVRPADTTFSHMFDQPGVFRYVCTPHAGIGMRGAIFVALE